MKSKIVLSVFFALLVAFCFVYLWNTPQGVPIGYSRDDYHAPCSPESLYLQIKNYEMASRLIAEIEKKGWILVCAESVSGGNMGVSLSRAKGAGSCFAGSAVCYKVEAKRKLLDVPDEKEDDLYDLQTARDMALGSQNLYRISLEKKVSPQESYYNKPIVSLSTTGRAVTYKDKWEGGVYAGLAFPDGKAISQYFPHTFINTKGEEDQARTKEEGMLVAAYKAMQYALKEIQEHQ